MFRGWVLAIKRYGDILCKNNVQNPNILSWSWHVSALYLIWMNMYLNTQDFIKTNKECPELCNQSICIQIQCKSSSQILKEIMRTNPVLTVAMTFTKHLNVEYYIEYYKWSRQ